MSDLRARQTGMMRGNSMIARFKGVDSKVKVEGWRNRVFGVNRKDVSAAELGFIGRTEALVAGWSYIALIPA
jgi:hypothetical protein